MADLSVMGFLNEETQQETEYNLKDAQARSDISTINSKIPSNASSNNKLATKSDVSAAYIPGGNAELATLPPLTSENLNRVFNMIYDFITNSDFVEGAGKSVKAGNEVGIVNVGTSASPVIKYTVFGGFFDTSSLQPKDLENPIEVAGIERDTVEDALFALSTDKEDIILVASPLVKEYDEVMRQDIIRLNQDDTPTDNSNNPVKSSGIKSALDATVDLLKDTTGWIGINRFNGKATTKTAQGVTWTVDANDNNIVTVSGTPTGFEAFTVDSNNVLPVGDYVLSGISDMVNVVYNGVFLYKNNVLARDLQIQDDNIPHTLSILQSDDYDTIRIQLKRATNGVACSGTGKIMITTPEEYKLSPTYEPYHDSVEEYAFPRSEQAVVGVKNLALANRAITQTISEMAFTVNSSDVNVVTANGTNSAEAWFNYMDIELPEGNYIGSGCTNGSDTTYMLSFVIRNAGNTEDEATIKCFSGDVNITVPIGGRHVRAFIVVRNGKTLTNQVFKLMIRHATDPDSTYAPYAMTNKELTENKVDKNVKTLTSSDDLNNITETGFYSVSTAPTNSPEGLGYYELIVGKRSDDNIQQMIIRTNNIYTRAYGSSQWSAWYKFTGTVVS